MCGQTFLLEFIYRACASRNEPAVKAGLSKATKTKLQHITLEMKHKKVRILWCDENNNKSDLNSHFVVFLLSMCKVRSKNGR